MRILFLDDDLARHKAFARLAIGHEMDPVTTAAQAIGALRENEYDLVALDHDLGGNVFVDSNSPEGTGYTVAKAMAEDQSLKRPRHVVVHSFNPAGVERIVNRLSDAGFSVQAAPFGTWMP